MSSYAFATLTLYFRSMNWATILDYIAQEWHAISILEMVAVAFSVTEVLLSYRNNVLPLSCRHCRLLSRHLAYGPGRFVCRIRTQHVLPYYELLWMVQMGTKE